MLGEDLSDLINRVGLLFLFISGIIISPEVIGATRLQDWEGKLESKATGVKNWMTVRLAYIDPKAAVIDVIVKVILILIPTVAYFVALMFITGLILGFVAAAPRRLNDILLAIS